MSSQIQQNDLQLSPIDSDRFGLRIGRVEQVGSESVESLLRQAAELDLDMIIARSAANDLVTAEALGGAGFRFLDADVHYRAPIEDVGRAGLPGDPVPVREATPADFELVVGIATTAFQNYPNHYRSDPRMDRAGVDAIFPDWTRRCLSGEAADFTLVAEVDSRLAGFSSFQATPGGDVKHLLVAVAGWASGRHVHARLAVAGARLAAGRGSNSFFGITQIGNVAAQRSWSRCGLKPSGGVFTFHLWRR